MAEGGDKHWGNTVTPTDLLVAAGGLAVLVGLALDWAGGEAGYSELSLLKAILILCGVGAVLLPPILASTRRQDLPVVWETMLLLVAIFVTALLLIRLLLPPEGGFDSGYLVVVAGMVVITVADWRTVSREA